LSSILRLGKYISMIESQDIKEEIQNTNGQSFLRFKDKLINLSHVLEVRGEQESEEVQRIHFMYSNGTSYEEVYDASVLFYKDLNIIQHCIAKGLFAVTLTKECHARWAKFSNEHGAMVDELNGRYSGMSSR